MQCHLQSKNGIYFVPSSAGEHSPQTFTLVGGGGQGETPNFLENWWQDEDKGCPRAQAPSSSVLERDHLTFALVAQRHFWDALPAPILASPNCTSSQLLQMFLLPGRYLAAAAPAGQWGGAGCFSGYVVRALSRENGSRSRGSYQKRGSEKLLSAGSGSQAA